MKDIRIRGTNKKILTITFCIVCIYILIPFTELIQDSVCTCPINGNSLHHCGPDVFTTIASIAVGIIFLTIAIRSIFVNEY